jgi:tyrosinase
MTFWDWTQDNLKLLQSPVMAAKLGFGGQASSTRTETLRSGSKIKCMDEGPFKNLRPSWIAFSPKEVVQQEHCFFRNVIDGPSNPDAVTMAPAYTAENIRKIQEEEEFYEMFEQRLEGSPHGVIHASLGGEMNPTTSPNGMFPLASD